MRLCTFQRGSVRAAGILLEDNIMPLSAPDIHEVIKEFSLADLANLASWPQQRYPVNQVTFVAPYLHPGKIWGIGLNYLAHAADLDEVSPDQEPASFMKPSTAVIGPDETVLLPPQSQRVIGEAELGVIIGRRCKNVPVEQAPDVIFGYTTIIDMTAEDILRRNPRFLTRAKSFDTFFSFGPVVVTADAIPEVGHLVVQTICNGKIVAENSVSNMMFSPYELVAFHSQVMTLEPGDILSTGTPGAALIQAGDTIACQISEIGMLRNPVAAA